jgi:hypothetical protein
MKSLLVGSIFVLAIGTGTQAWAQGPADHAVDLTRYMNPMPAPNSPNAGGPNANSSAATASATPDNTAEEDDTLYRGKTSETLGQPGLRDEGPLHFKRHAKEKVQEVDSAKKLQRSAPDPRFEGSLLHSSVTSINDVAPKPEEDRNADNEGDPRFESKRLTFKRGQDEHSAKRQAESSPSPTPSATASPQKKDSKATDR